MGAKLFLICALLSANFAISQNDTIRATEVEIPSKGLPVMGTLLMPQAKSTVPLLILIPGSGPTDRDGNQAIMQNNSLKFLAEALVKNGIATFRYDKKILQLMNTEGFKEDSIKFDAFIADAADVIEYFNKDRRFSKIIVGGHSQGSLVGMIAAREGADGFISLEGAGRPVDEILQEQLLKQAPALEKDINRTLDSLRSGKQDPAYSKYLAGIFRESVQPFIISWIRYNPQTEIQKLSIPVLIVNGTKDVQVPVSDAELLHENNKASRIGIIANMNHILKTIDGDLNENMASYYNPDLPVSDELVHILTDFVKSIK
ncbi:MAG: alpha/beta hydrolase [Flavobacteriaceae bacterium]|nr:alpha/beta hydrolase [Flavobacteriaceae bacterium]